MPAVTTRNEDDPLDSVMSRGLLPSEDLDHLANMESGPSVSQVNTSFKWGNGENYCMCYFFIHCYFGELICIFFSLALVLCVLQEVILLHNLRPHIADYSPGISCVHFPF